ncbi:MAG: hypothetical protein IPI34_02455 [bacterium]|nr:hypothetical protein [bacterium]
MTSKTSSSKAPLRYLLLALATLTAAPTFGATVPVGLGSYSTTLPSGAVGPQNSSGANVSPKVAPAFAQPVQSNDFWSSLIYPFYSNPHTNVLYAHPLMVKSIATGLQVGHTTTPVFAANDDLFPYSIQLTVGVAGLSPRRRRRWAMATGPPPRAGPTRPRRWRPRSATGSRSSSSR